MTNALRSESYPPFRPSLSRGTLAEDEDRRQSRRRSKDLPVLGIFRRRRRTGGKRDGEQREGREIDGGQIQPPVVGGDMAPGRVEDVKHGVGAVKQRDHREQDKAVLD